MVRPKKGAILPSLLIVATLFSGTTALPPTRSISNSRSRRRLRKHKNQVFEPPKPGQRRKGSHKNSYKHNEEEYPAHLSGFYGYYEETGHPYVDEFPTQFPTFSGDYHDHDHDHGYDDNHDYHQHYHYHDTHYPTYHPTFHPTFYPTFVDGPVVYKYSGKYSKGSKSKGQKGVATKFAANKIHKAKGVNHGQVYGILYEDGYEETLVPGPIHNEYAYTHPGQDYYHVQSSDDKPHYHDPHTHAEQDYYHVHHSSDGKPHYHNPHTHAGQDYHHVHSLDDDYHPPPLQPKGHPVHYCNSKRSKQTSKSRKQSGGYLYHYHDPYETIDYDCIPLSKSKKSKSSKSKGRGSRLRPPGPAPHLTPFPTFFTLPEVTPVPSSKMTIPASENSPINQASLLDYRFADGTTPRELSNQEIDDLETQTNLFYAEVFRNTYRDGFVSFNAEIDNDDVIFNGGADFPITIDLDYEVQFAEGATPPMEEVASTMRGANYTLYIQDYLGTLSMQNPFSNTTQVDFTPVVANTTTPPDDDSTPPPQPPDDDANMGPPLPQPTAPVQVETMQPTATVTVPMGPTEVTVDLVPFGLLWDIDRARVPEADEYTAALLVIQQYFNDWFARGYTGSPPDMSLFVADSTALVGGQTAYSLISGAFADYTGSTKFRGDGDYVVPTAAALDMSLDMAFMQPYLQDVLDLLAASLPSDNIFSTATNIRYVENSEAGGGRRRRHRTSSKFTLQKGILMVAAFGMLGVLLYWGVRMWKESRRQRRIQKSGAFFGGEDIIMGNNYDGFLIARR